MYIIIGIGFSSTRAGSYEAFFQAVIRDDIGTLRSLLAQGMDPNSRDPKGYPALALAVRRESPRAFAMLLAHPDTDVNALNSAGESALMLAAIAGDLETCDRLLARGANVQQPGWSPIHYAASGPGTKIVERLLDRGAAVDAEAPNGTTPLMLAAQHAPEATVSLLLQHGADTRRRNQRGLQAIDFAELGGREWLVERFEKLPR
ncbi:ankyrin repeat domain-containing protein [uncultured Piscinibacter sp.]|uniref:ankyrin repeat domain-containing protein n=1 Tax=uncultured Piscinibacter sp. TaxID=1131835 RepID=UPI00260ADFBB|nr:ankyrin repeat domain-containing protein [uncultured Piscinibacter sp.]